LRRDRASVNSAGEFAGDAADSPFVIGGSYLGQSSFYEDNVVRAGLEMTFVSAHRPLQAYTDAINDAGIVIERFARPCRARARAHSATEPPLAAPAAVPAPTGLRC
jgi:hypothetical protein